MLCPPAWASSLMGRVLKAGSIFTFNPGLKMEKQKKKSFFWMYANLLIRSDIMNYWSRYLVNFLHGLIFRNQYFLFMIHTSEGGEADIVIVEGAAHSELDKGMTEAMTRALDSINL